MKIPIILMLTVIGLLAGGYAFEKRLQTSQHVLLAAADTELNAKIIEGGLESDIQRIELELKMYRSIAERRELTPDEQDRVAYLKELRTILLAEQRKRVA